MKTLTTKEIQVFQNGEWVTVPVLVAGGNSSGLPDVTANDNGKVPQVINGEWVMSDNIKKQLDQINVYLGEADSLSWAQKMEYVRAGLGRSMFPVGTQFNTSHGLLGNILWDVADHDHFPNPANPSGHTMTLITHYQFRNNHRALSVGRAIYYAEEGLPAGSYSFVVKGRTTRLDDNDVRFYFTIENAIPAGGQIRQISIRYSDHYDGGTAGVFADQEATQPSETFTFTTTAIQGATDLGDAGTGNLNISGCVDNGSTDYDISDLRIWLNSDADTGEWWNPTNKFSRIAYENTSEPSSTIKNWMITEPGFMHDIDPNFLACVIAVDYPCCATTAYSVNHTLLEEYAVRDRFTIPSSSEVGVSASGDQRTVGTCLEFFANADDTKRIKYKGINLAEAQWVLRNPKTVNYANNVMRAITSKGKLDGAAAATDGFVFMCTLG